MTFELKNTEDIQKKKENGLDKISKDLEPLEDLAHSKGKNLYIDYDSLPNTLDEHLILEFIPKEETIIETRDLFKKNYNSIETKVLAKMYDATIAYMMLKDQDFWKSVEKKAMSKVLSKGYIATSAAYETINKTANWLKSNTQEGGTLNNFAIGLDTITKQENVESIREYLKEITLSDKFEKEKQLSKEEVFQELKKPEYRLGPRVAKKISKIAMIKEDYIPNTLKSAKRIRENMAAIGMGLVFGGQMYKRQAVPSAEVMDTSIEMIAKSDFISSYIMSPITAFQLAVPMMAISGGDYWASYVDAILAIILETKARSQIFKKKGTYLPAPLKLITPTTAATIGLATIHEGYHFIRETEEKLNERSESWRDYKKSIKDLYKGTIGEIAK